MARSFQITSLFPHESVKVNALIALQGTRKGRYNVARYLMKDGTAQAPRPGASIRVERASGHLRRRDCELAGTSGQHGKLESPLSLAS